MNGRATAAWNAIAAPTDIGGRRFPPIGLVVLAGLGAILLLVVAVNRWAQPQDEHAYWLAAQRLLNGQPLYDPAATSVTPYAYWYPPPLAQVLAPVSALLSSDAFSAAWTVLLIGALLALSRGRPFVALAMVAFLPVAVELWFRNVHLVLAALIAFGIVRWPWLFSVGAAIKIAPGLGVVYLVLRRRWRDAAIAIGAGLAILVVSFLLGPGLWSDFASIVGGRGPGDVSGLVPVPYVVRVAAGLAITVVAAASRPRIGEPLLVVAIVVASPTLWLDAFSMLIAVVPVVLGGPHERPRETSGRGAAATA